MFHAFTTDKLLSEISTFGIGGPAKFFIEVRAIELMTEVLLFCKSASLPFVVVGKGSNCLFDSRGFDGLVIHNKIDFYQETVPGHIYVGAGYSFALLGRNSAKQGLSGLEFASGIPATVGGAVFMNAGVQGSETKDYLESVDFIDFGGNYTRFHRQKIVFGYRHSSFQSMLGAIVAASFILQPMQEATKKQRELLDYRIKTQPYSDKSAGCVFRNPEGFSTGKIIDSLGLKQYSVGGASISAVHANFIVNSGNATSDDVKTLIQIIRDKVKQERGLELEVEVRMIPYTVNI